MVGSFHISMAFAVNVFVNIQNLFVTILRTRVLFKETVSEAKTEITRRYKDMLLAVNFLVNSKRLLVILFSLIVLSKLKANSSQIAVAFR